MKLPRCVLFLVKIENMKIFSRLCCVAVLIILAACGKKNDKKLARTYFRTAFLELADDRKGSGRLQAALQNINRAIDQSEQPEYYALKATILHYLGHASESMSVFNAALALPMDRGLKAQIMNNYACVLAEAGEIARAKKIWQDLAASSWYATPEVAWVNQGKLCLNDGDPMRAKEAFKTAAMLAPQYVDAHFYYAVAAQAAGQLSAAKEALQAVFKLEPDHEQALVFADRFALLG